MNSWNILTYLDIIVEYSLKVGMAPYFFHFAGRHHWSCRKNLKLMLKIQTFCVVGSYTLTIKCTHASSTCFFLMHHLFFLLPTSMLKIISSHSFGHNKEEKIQFKKIMDRNVWSLHLFSRVCLRLKCVPGFSRKSMIRDYWMF